MKQPGFIENLRADIERGTLSLRSLVDRPGGLREEELMLLLREPQGNELQSVEVPMDSNVSFYHDDLDGYAEIGQQQKFVHCIYAGEVNPKNGDPKALTRVPGLGISLLAIKLLQTPRECETWIVGPPHLRKQIENHISCLSSNGQSNIRFIEQDSVYMLTPDYSLVKNELMSCGSGGCIMAFQRDDCIKNFVRDGGKYVYVTDVSNVLATPSLEILGHHVKHNSKLTYELVRRTEEDPGSVLVESENGVNLVDPVRLSNVDLSNYGWRGTGSVILNADLDFSAALPNWRRVRRVYKNYLTVRYERFIEELSEAYTANYVGVARGERFLRVDSLDDMEEISKRLMISLV